LDNFGLVVFAVESILLSIVILPRARKGEEMDNTVDGLIQRAMTEAKTGNKLKARNLLIKALEIDKNNARIWYLLSQVIDDVDKKIKCLEQAQKIQPDNPQIKEKLNLLKGPTPLPDFDKKPTIKKNKNRNIFIIGGIVSGGIIIVCLCLAAVVIGDYKETIGIATPRTQGATQASTLPTSTAIPQPTAALSALDALKEAISATLGDGNRNVRRLNSLTMDDIDGISVQFAINDNLNEDLIRLGARRDVFRILELVHDSRIGYSSVGIVGTFPMKDSYGNVTEGKVVSLLYKKATIDKINWDGFDYDNMFEIADINLNIDVFNQ